jgi:hypothetical protein
VLHARLVLTESACLDCILPKDYLEQLITNAVQKADPTIVRTDLDDPRPSEHPLNRPASAL